MIMHIHYLVYDERKPFSYLDFMNFEVGGHEFKMSHGTFRNSISRLVREGLVEISYRSNIAFYTLRGVKFGKASRITMTGNHTGVPSASSPLSSLSRCSNPLYRIVRDLPLEKSSVHDIRLRFVSPRIYTIISSLISNNGLGYDYTVNSKSHDIKLPVWKIGDLLVKATIHRTDTVSVMVGCSLNPVALDINGIIRLTNALSIVEERLSRVIDGSHSVKGFSLIASCSSSSRAGCKDTSLIPAHSEWIVTMWHFGADASVEYTGEKFSVTWGLAQDAIIRVYSKNMKDHKTRIRLERQEYPRTTLALALEQKISLNHNRWSGGE
jgi:hypothetical protein